MRTKKERVGVDGVQEDRETHTHTQRRKEEVKEEEANKETERDRQVLWAKEGGREELVFILSHSDRNLKSLGMFLRNFQVHLQKQMLNFLGRKSVKMFIRSDTWYIYHIF